MYNGVGLVTPRGSGTNGYVQRNLAHVKVSKDKASYRTEEDIQKMEATLNRPPNAEILEHERRRKIEVKCFELQELMTDQGFPEDEIESKVKEYRQLLTKQMERSEDPTSEEVDDYGRRVATETHQIAELQQEKNARLRAAFSISDDYIDGSAVARNKTKSDKDIKPPKNVPEREPEVSKQQLVAVESEPKVVEKPIKELSKTKRSEIEKRPKLKSKRHSDSSSRRRKDEEVKRKKRKRTPSSSEDGSATSSSESSSSSSSESGEESSSSSSDSDESASSSSSESSEPSTPVKKKKQTAKSDKRSNERSHKIDKSSKREKAGKIDKSGKAEKSSKTERVSKSSRRERSNDRDRRRSRTPERKRSPPSKRSPPPKRSPPRKRSPPPRKRR